jgi:D-glycero-D-manno-heptose 1,7-bisphosphate phosphatase
MNKNRAVLLDRDGVINIDGGYIGTLERFSFVEGLFPFLRAVRDLGFRLAILTNQSGIARGMFSEADYNTVTAHLLSVLRREGIDIDLTLACFDHPEGTVAPFARESFWRKPNPGMVLEVIRRLNLDPAKSAFIGDSERDMHAAQGGGIKKCLWLTQNNPVSQKGITIIGTFSQALQHLV